MAASKNSGVIVAESTSATDNNNQQYESEWRYHTTPPTRQLLDRAVQPAMLLYSAKSPHRKNRAIGFCKYRKLRMLIAEYPTVSNSPHDFAHI
jgi:hypothetical protein